MANKKNFVRLDKIRKTAHFESVVVEGEDLIAGQFVNLGKVVAVSDGELTEATKATAGQVADAFLCPVYVDKGYYNYRIEMDSIPEGKPARALIPAKGDIISINEELASGITAGQDVEVGEDGLGFKAASEGTAIGKCIAVETYPNIGKLVVIRFK